METLGSPKKFTASRDLCPRRRLRDNACQLRAEILRDEEDTKPQRRHDGAMVPWSNETDPILGLSWDFHMSCGYPLKLLVYNGINGRSKIDDLGVPPF
jgi:hypothetical protein